VLHEVHDRQVEETIETLPRYQRPFTGKRLSFRRNPLPYSGGKNSTFHLASVYSVRMTYEQLVDFLQNRMKCPTSTSPSC
jgi:hypothetical protein